MAIIRGKDKGFTLVELLLAIIIFGLLAAIAMAQFSELLRGTYNTVAMADLRNAYIASKAYFSHNPNGAITPSILSAHGYRGTAKVNFTIVNNTLPGLLMIASFSAPGCQTYLVNVDGTIIPLSQAFNEFANLKGPSGSPPAGDIQPGNNAGRPFDLPGANDLTKAELQKAFEASLAYLGFHPEGTVTKDILQEYGYTPDPQVNLVIVEGSLPGLAMMAAANVPGSQTYLINFKGNIVP